MEDSLESHRHGSYELVPLFRAQILRQDSFLPGQPPRLPSLSRIHARLPLPVPSSLFDRLTSLNIQLGWCVYSAGFIFGLWKRNLEPPAVIVDKVRERRCRKSLRKLVEELEIID